MAGGGELSDRPDDRHERRLRRRHGGPVAGIDEAGRGPWAGPVVAAAVILDRTRIPEGLDDSKRLTPRTRERLYDEIVATACVGVAVGEVARIDRDNVLHASLWAMRTACAALAESPASALIDGNRCPDLSCPAQALIAGDRRSVSVAAASIVAKVARDRLMADLARDFDGYGWHTNKGYGTPEHAAAIRRLGVTAHHRRTWRPVRLALQGTLLLSDWSIAEG